MTYEPTPVRHSAIFRVKDGCELTVGTQGCAQCMSGNLATFGDVPISKAIRVRSVLARPAKAWRPPFVSLLQKG